MSSQETRYFVTDEQVNAALRAIEEFPEGKDKVPAEKAGPSRVNHLWNIRAEGRDSIGLHLRNNQTFVVQINKKQEIGYKGVLRAGYEQPDKLMEEILSLSTKMGRTAHYSMTISGKHAPFLITKAPDLKRPVLQKTFKVQMKALVGEEVEEVTFIKLPTGPEKKEGSSDYLAALVTPAILDRTVDILKRAKLRLTAWDCDMLCYGRAASYLWQVSGLSDETRFVVVMGWNRCRLLIMGGDGRFVAPVLPMGVVSFLEHLSTSLGEPTVNSAWLDSKKLLIQPNDPPDLRQKKILANQALFTLFVPFAQQIKMYLYKGCNDYGIPLPKHFSVVGPGANLFRISDTLEVDLSLKALYFSDGLEPESAAALGAALWDRHDTHLNMLPVTGGEFVERLKDFGLSLKEKVGSYLPKSAAAAPAGGVSLKLKTAKLLTLGAIALLAVIAYPIWSRSSASRNLAQAKREVDALGPKKEELLNFSEKQSQLEKKLVLKKILESKRSKAGLLLKELLFHLPQSVKLSNILYREKVVNLKGVAKSQGDLEMLLEEYSKLEYVQNPEPLSIRRNEEKVSFEVQMKLKEEN